MRDLFFWKTWLKEYRVMWYAMAALFILSLLLMWYAWFRGADSVIHWENIQQQKTVETVVHSFRLGPFALDVPAESYVIVDYFQGADLQPNTLATYAFAIVMMVCVVVLLTVVSVTEKFWYLVGMALFILFVVGLRLELLGIFGRTDRVPAIVVMAAYILPSFYINRFRSTLAWTWRLLIFTAITVVLGLIIFFFATVPLSFLQFSLSLYVPSLILSVLFMILVAHEIIAGFVYIINQGTSRHLQHLSIISTIYLVNVIITCLHEMGVIQWDFIYLNVYLLLTLSALLGIWGYRHRENAYGHILAFYPFGGYLFLALGTICFMTLGQLMANANDPALKVMRASIVTTHAGYGLIFVLYLFSNFVLLLARSMPIYKVLYAPTRMPYFVYRLAGLITTLAFILAANWQNYIYHGLAGSYNNSGDLYTLLGNQRYAESFYEQARLHGFQNHHANYALARMRTRQFDLPTAHEYYGAANRVATPFSVVNNANLYLWEDQPFDAIQAFRRGEKTLPLPELQSNLGVAYGRVHNLDSALAYLDKARASASTRSVAEGNFFALASLDIIPFNADSVVKVFDTQAPGTLANALVLATLFRQPFEQTIDPLADSTLDLFTATLLNNYIIKNAKSLDTTFTQRALAIANAPANRSYAEALKSSLAFGFYHQGNVAKALELLAEQVYLSQTYQGRFNYIMGLWALENNNAARAASYFRYADTYAYKDARLYYAIAETETGRLDAALTAWDSVARWGEAGQQPMAAAMRNLLTMPAAQALALDDAAKYQYCRYRMALRDSLTFDKIINTFTSPDYKAQALLDISRRYFEADQVSAAVRYYRRIAGLAMTDRNLYEDVRHFELLLLAYRGELQALARQINTGITFPASRALEKMLYTGLLSASSGDSAKAAASFRVLAHYNPYFEEGVLAAARFFHSNRPGDLTAYTILAEAIQVNDNSIRLLKAYIAEAQRIGLDDYATDAWTRLQALQAP